MTKLKLAATVLFVAAAPILLIAASVRWVINAPVLYSSGFDRHNIEAATGIERGELLSAARQIRDYFNDDVEYMDVMVTIRNVRRPLYNEREILHMKDVKGLVRGVYRISEAAAGYMLVFALVGFTVQRGAFYPRLLRLLRRGGIVTLAAVVVVGLGAIIGFDRLFLAFHLVSFSNDLWQLDPRTDYLLIMFPQRFFFEATMWIAGSVVLSAVLLAAVPTFLLRSASRAAELPTPALEVGEAEVSPTGD